MTFQDRLQITTSEGVTVNMTIAGIGSRSLSWLIDGIVIAAALFLLGLAAFNTFDVDGLLTAGLLSFAILLVPLSYLVGMESLNGGRTLGKMAAGIKVVRVTGAPVGFGSAVVRTLFVPIDFLVFGVGVIAMFVNGRSQRIGDLAAGTVVVRDRIRAGAAGPAVEALPNDGPRWDVSAVTEEEIGVIRSFLGRAAGLPAEARADYARRLRERIEPRVGAGDPSLSPEAFLARVVAEKQRQD